MNGRFGILCGLFLVLGVLSCTCTAQDIEVITPRVMIKLNIDNPAQREMSLFRFGDGVQVEVAKLTGKTRESISVESGLYWLSETERPKPGLAPVQIPVPALADALKSTPKQDNEQLQLSLMISQPRRYQADLCWIPGGPALIGDHLGVGQPDERPVRVIDVPGFWIGRSEVTNKQYTEFLNSVEEVDGKWLDLNSRLCLIHKRDTRFETEHENLPVVTVTYAGAIAYCNWRSEQTGLRYRLLTEIEWEKAARGPQSLIFSYGNVYDPDAANQESGRVVDVNRFGSNGFGVFDMTGNVFEWVMADENKATQETRPGNARTYSHPLRGGSFVLDGMYLRNSFKMRQSPDVMADDIGFRVAVDDCSSLSPEN